MKILLIGNYQLDELRSMDIFTSMLASHMLDLGHQVRIIQPKPWLGKLLSSPNITIRKWLGYIDKFVFFPQQILQSISWADVVHICDQGNALYSKYLQNKAFVITCHDLIAIRSGLGEVPEYSPGWAGKQLLKEGMKGINQAQKVACVSEETRQDVLRLSLLPESCVSTIYNGLHYKYTPMSAEEYQPYLNSLGIPQGYQFIVHVGGNQWYKNRLGVLSIFHHLTLQLQEPNFYLVMVGKPMTSEMNQFIKDQNISHKVIQLVGIDNESLRAVYSSATALLFPSLYEGFGWPIIEAQACGCPVFTSNLHPMVDIGGEAAIYLDPEQPQQCAEKIIFNLSEIKNLRAKGLENSQRFSADRMIREYLMLYEQAINEKHPTFANTL